jgi:signal peptidase I
MKGAYRMAEDRKDPSIGGDSGDEGNTENVGGGDAAGTGSTADNNGGADKKGEVRGGTLGGKKKPNPFKIVFDVVFLIVFVAFLGILFFSVATRDGESSGAEVGAYKALVVLTGSMSPVIMPDDIVIVKDATFEDFAVDDVVTYLPYKGEDVMFITHRVVGIDLLKRQFTTKGDANATPDGTPLDFNRVVGKVILVVPRLGAVTRFMARPGVIISIVIIYAAALIVSKIMKSEPKDEEKPL